MARLLKNQVEPPDPNRICYSFVRSLRRRQGILYRFFTMMVVQLLDDFLTGSIARPESRPHIDSKQSLDEFAWSCRVSNTFSEGFQDVHHLVI